MTDLVEKTTQELQKIANLTQLETLFLHGTVKNVFEVSKPALHSMQITGRDIPPEKAMFAAKQARIVIQKIEAILEREIIANDFLPEERGSILLRRYLDTIPTPEDSIDTNITNGDTSTGYRRINRSTDMSLASSSSTSYSAGIYIYIYIYMYILIIFRLTILTHV
jgi:hypothetical protein